MEIILKRKETSEGLFTMRIIYHDALQTWVESFLTSTLVSPQRGRYMMTLSPRDKASRLGNTKAAVNQAKTQSRWENNQNNDVTFENNSSHSRKRVMHLLEVSIITDNVPSFSKLIHFAKKEKQEKNELLGKFAKFPCKLRSTLLLCVQPPWHPNGQNPLVQSIRNLRSIS